MRTKALGPQVMSGEYWSMISHGFLGYPILSGEGGIPEICREICCLIVKILKLVTGPELVFY